MASDDHGKHGFGFIFVVSLAITSAITAFGAASALAVILVRAYSSGMIILLGAEFTQEWAAEHGHAIMPEKGAVCTGVAERKARRTTAPAVVASPAARARGRPSPHTPDVAGSATGSSPCRCWSFCSTVAMR